MHIVRLVFNNVETRPKRSVVEVDIDSANDVCIWYAGHHAGDPFTLTMNGRNVPLDISGEPEWDKMDKQKT